MLYQNRYLKTVSYGCKELHVTYGRFPGSASDKGFSQQPEVLLKNEPPHLTF